MAIWRMPFEYDDGGRMEAGYKGKASDCVCRAIAIASGLPYQAVYDLIDRSGQQERKTRRRNGKSSAREGVYKATQHRLLASLGWQWTPTMQIGSGCTTHLRQGELPKEGRLIIQLSRHVTAVIDGVIHDNHNPDRDGTRCVYGYWNH